MLLELNKKSFSFFKKNYSLIEEDKNNIYRHANEQLKFILIKSIEEHTSGINQMIQVPHHFLVSVSDDCSMKFWNENSLKIEN